MAHTTARQDHHASHGRSCPVFIVDPFGTTRDYDEALYANVYQAMPQILLLTTRFNDRRHNDRLIGEGFFLRGTAWLQRRSQFMPRRLLKACGAIEYFIDLLRLALTARRQGAIVHWQWLPFPALAVPLLRVLRLTSHQILTAHDVRPHTAHERQRLSRGERLRYRFANAIVVHGRSLADELKTLEPSVAGKIAIIPHGLNYEDRQKPDRALSRQRQKLPRDATLVGFIGLLRPHKGLADLLRAWMMVRERNQVADACLVIAGEWREEEWKGSASREGAAIQDGIVHEPSIIYRPGYLPERDFLEVLSSMDVVVLPYRYASQSGIALSALRFGIPLIVSRRGALTDILGDELQQWVFDPESVDQLTARILDFLNLEKGCRAQISALLHDRSLEHSWINLRADYARIYSTVLSMESR